MGSRAPIIFDQPFSDLTKSFNAGCNVTRVEIPTDLYREFLKLYKRSDNLQYKLEMVMNDGEHQLIMEEGRGDFRLPRKDFLQKEIIELKETLKSFNPYLTLPGHQKRVSLRSEQIQGFFNLFAKDYDVVHSLFEMFRHTDYLRYHKYLRDVQQVKYAGPTSLQEIVQVFFGIVQAQNKQRHYLRELSLGNNS